MEQLTPESIQRLPRQPAERVVLDDVEFRAHLILLTEKLTHGHHMSLFLELCLAEPGNAGCFELYTFIVESLGHTTAEVDIDPAKMEQVMIRRRIALVHAARMAYVDILKTEEDQDSVTREKLIQEIHAEPHNHRFVHGMEPLTWFLQVQAHTVSTLNPACMKEDAQRCAAYKEEKPFTFSIWPLTGTLPQAMIDGQTTPQFYGDLDSDVSLHVKRGLLDILRVELLKVLESNFDEN